MNEKKLFDAVTNVPDDLVEEAKSVKLKKSLYHPKKWMAVAVCLALIIGAACIIPQFGGNADRALIDVVFPQAYAFGDTDIRREIMNNNPVDDTFLAALNDFSYKTAARILTEKRDNTNYSPLSLYYGLAMAASGAGGETVQELLTLLGMPDQTTLSEQCGNLYRQLYTDNKIERLQIGNSLWMDRSIVWKEEYVKNAARNFYAFSFSRDFSDAKTERLMAQWVSDRTNGTLKPKIKIDPEQVLSIINTICFYDEWIDKFEKYKTAAGKFYLPDSTAINCSFMNRTYSSAAFSKGDGFTRSSLGLKNSASMVFILPDEGISPRELLSSPEKVKEVFENVENSNGEVIWQIPKFNFGCSLDFTNVLKNLGVSSAFKQDADFSGISDSTAYISNIQQETHISIDENGVEATAFTQIAYPTAKEPQGRAEMILNRPFIYGITASNGTLLFVGICENPVK